MVSTGNSPTKPQSYRPPYKRIEAEIRHKISRGVWSAGMIVPSRRELAGAYGVSLGTIERAMADLLADGTLVSRDRRGTFVSGAGAGTEGVVFTYSSIESSGTAGLAESPQRVLTIGVVTSIEPRVNSAEWQNGWPYIAISAIERQITSLGMRTRFHYVDPTTLTKAVDINETIDQLFDDGVDGFVFVMLKDADMDIAIRRFAPGVPNAFPAVFVLTDERIIPGTSVYYDSRDAGFHAARHLIDQGCRSLMFVSPYTSTFGSRRLAGVREAMSLAGVPADRLVVHVKPSQIEDEYNDYDAAKGLRWIDQRIAGAAWAETFLGGDLEAEGVIAINDEVAIGFMEAAAKAGHVAGTDYAIIGFDDVPSARANHLTTMRPPLDAMGEEAARLIIQSIQGSRNGQKISLHSQLIARPSTEPLRREAGAVATA